MCAEKSVNKNNFKIDNKTIKFVESALSNYHKEEIIDEVYRLLPDIEEMIHLITNMRKWTFCNVEFKNEY